MNQKLSVRGGSTSPDKQAENMNLTLLLDLDDTLLDSDMDSFIPVYFKEKGSYAISVTAGAITGDKSLGIRINDVEVGLVPIIKTEAYAVMHEITVGRINIFEGKAVIRLSIP